MYFIKFTKPYITTSSQVFLCFCFTIAFALLNKTSFAQNEQYIITHYSPEDYRAGIQNIDLTQNRNQSIYIANNLGIISFDGEKWEQHDLHSGKKKRSLAFSASENRLYVGAQGVFGYYHDDWDYTDLSVRLDPQDQNFDDVWDTYILGQNVYFCTFAGIYVYDTQADQIQVKRWSGGLNKAFLVGQNVLCQGTDGTLLEVGSIIEKKNWPQMGHSDQLSGVLSEEDAYLLFYNSGRIEKISPYSSEWVYPSLSKAIAGKYVNHVLELSDRRIAIATQTAGLYIYHRRSGEIEHIQEEDGLASNACLRSYQDQQGHLWVGLQNGIAKIDINAPMRLIEQSVGIDGSGYDAIDVPSGTYYTSSNGIYYRPQATDQAQFLAGSEGPAYSMHSIAGRTYACHHRGLYELQNGSAQHIADINGLWDIKIYQRDPRYAVGGSYTGLHLFKIGPDRRLEHLGPLDGFEESSRYLHEDPDGQIWVSQYYKGLYEIDLDIPNRKAYATYIEQGDLPIYDQVSIHRIDDRLALSTRHGLYWIDTQTRKITRDSSIFPELHSANIFALQQDQENNIHVIAESFSGMYRRTSPTQYTFTPTSLSKMQYSINNDLLSIASNVQEGVLISANEGFIHYRPNEEYQQRNNPLTLRHVYSQSLDSFLIRSTPFEDRSQEGPTLKLDYKHNDVEIAVGPSQLSEAPMRYRYWMEGLEAGYGPWLSTPSRSYNHLNSGKYTLHAQAIDYLGQTSSSPSLRIEIGTPWYKAWYAILGYIALALLLLRWRSKQQRKVYREKEAKRKAAEKEKIAAKEAQLKEIEKEKNNAISSLKEKQMATELRHVNNLLAASTMNLVVKNEFIETIKAEVEEIRSKGKNVETRHALDKIIKEIDSSLRLQEDWEQFEFHFDQVHGDFLTRLRSEHPNLTPNEQKLCAMLRLNLSTKEIAHLMSISQRGVEVARYRLRKKLDLEKGQNLAKFILKY